MPVHEFFFAVDASGGALSAPPGREPDDDLLGEITLQALVHAGIAADADPIVDAVRGALRQMIREDGHTVRGQCRVQFRVEDRQLTILVTSPAGRTWQQTHRTA